MSKKGDFFATPMPSTGGGGGMGGAFGCVFYVNPVVGSDVTGDGSEGNPFRTIAFAFSKIPPHGNSYSVWANERWTIYCQCGRYPEPGPIVLRQVRRSIRLYGNGAIIENEVRFVNDIADYPDGALFNPLLVPSPWGPPDNTIPLVNFEIEGEGGGMEGGFPSNNFTLLGRLLYRVVSPQIAAFSPVFWWGTRIQSLGGWEYENTSGAGAQVTTEIDSASIINRHIGSDGAAGANMNLKAHNSQLRGTIGPFCNILEIDSCRVQNIDRLTDFSGGAVAGRIVSVLSVVQSQVSDVAFGGTVYQIGAPAPGGFVLALDSISFKRLMAQGFTLTNCTFLITDTLIGTTAQRPAVNDGTMFFDTTLGKPIWRLAAALPTGWVDATGAVA